MRILIFGGTFNPPHKGHIHICERAMEALECDKLIVVPAKSRQFKLSVDGSPGDYERIALCRTAFSHLNAEISDFEIRSKDGYLIDTLIHLQERFPDDELFFLCGSDVLHHMERWYRFGEFCKYCTFAVYPRGNSASGDAEKSDYYRKKYGLRIVLLDESEFFCSSTELRRELKNDVFSKKIQEKVAAEIIDLGLYR